ncbi:uncharacterized protein [Musca autumnalis]|uniref:uncharacterized protein n=1 Tax=Musca autumnalis TaxID=221902 RepID=UPI003CEA3925
MSQVFSIKTESFDNDYKQEDSGNDTNTLVCNTIKLENFKNMANNIKEEQPDLDKMDEFLPENVDKYKFDIIKEEDVEEMDEFLPEDSTSIHSTSLLSWKSDDRTEVITHDVALHQHDKEQHQNSTITKFEIIDLDTDEDDSKGLEVTDDDKHTKVSDNREDSRESNDSWKSDDRTEVITPDVALHQHDKEQHRNSTITKFEIIDLDTDEDDSKGLEVTDDDKHTKVSDNREDSRESNDTCANEDTETYVISPSRVAQKAAKYKCEICGCCYNVHHSLLAHIRNKHPSSLDSDYVCEICNKKFTSPISRGMHYYREHSVVAPKQYLRNINVNYVVVLMQNLQLSGHI